MMDPPDHTRLRQVLSPAFSATAILEIGETVRDVTRDAFQSLRHGRVLDWMCDVAYQVPLTVVCEIIGVPPPDRAEVGELARQLGHLLEPMSTPTEHASSQRASLLLAKYFSVQLARATSSSRTSLISTLQRAYHQESISRQEMITTPVLMLHAGFATTTNLLGNMILAFTDHPGQFDLLRSDIGRLPAAVEELIRYAGPVHMVTRIARNDVTLEGTKVRKGEVVYVVLASANRDEAKFDNPDDFNIARLRPRHLGFGSGLHFCLGALLARLEVSAVLDEIADLGRLPLAVNQAQMQSTVVFRGPVRLDLTF